MAVRRHGVLELRGEAARRGQGEPVLRAQHPCRRKCLMEHAAAKGAFRRACGAERVRAAMQVEDYGLAAFLPIAVIIVVVVVAASSVRAWEPRAADDGGADVRIIEQAAVDVRFGRVHGDEAGAIGAGGEGERRAGSDGAEEMQRRSDAFVGDRLAVAPCPLRPERLGNQVDEEKWEPDKDDEDRNHDPDCFARLACEECVGG